MACLFPMHLKKCGSESYLGSSCKSIRMVFPIEDIGLLRNMESIASSLVSICKEGVIPVWLRMLFEEVYCF